MENLLLQLLQAIQAPHQTPKPAPQQSLLQQLAVPTPQTSQPQGGGVNQTSLIQPNHGFKFPQIADQSPEAVNEYLKREETNYQPPADPAPTAAPAAQASSNTEPEGQWAIRHPQFGGGSGDQAVNGVWLDNNSIGENTPGARFFEAKGL